VALPIQNKQSNDKLIKEKDNITMSIKTFDKIILCKSFWIVLSFEILGIYLFPLISGNLHVPVYDNLDSNVVWYKILSESGKLFAENNSMIPNMLNGLPRSSYGSEFDLLLWLYVFFSPKIAYILNEFLTHLVAFFGMYLLLSRYFIVGHSPYRYLFIYLGTIYFAILPFWTGAGITTASLPLTTYVLLDIHYRRDKFWHWIYLFLLPFYSSFVLLYMFYIIYGGIFLGIVSLKNHKVDWRLFNALLLLCVLFLLKDYRLIYSMFFDSTYISHRTEFDVFFNANALETYRLTLVKFLQGHIPHAQGLQQLYLIPISVIALTLSLVPRRFTHRESMLLWTIILLSFAANIWYDLLVNRYSLFLIFLLSLLLILTKNRHSPLAWTFLVILLIDTFSSLFQYHGLKWLTEYLPLLKSLNFVRFYFIEPMLLAVLLIYSLNVFINKLSYTPTFALLFLMVQFSFSLDQSPYQTKIIRDYLSFEEYYDPSLFDKIKKDLHKEFSQKPLSEIHVINYGIEPAVALYNGLYTVDGYSTNYPLSYKKLFRKTQDNILDLPIMAGNRELYDHWGSKVYLVGVDSRVQTYNYYRNSTISPLPLNASIEGICALGTDVLISSHPLKGIEKKPIKLIHTYRGHFWTIWLYRLYCNKEPPLP
jgi:hypothetical protein